VFPSPSPGLAPGLFCAKPTATRAEKNAIDRRPMRWDQLRALGNTRAVQFSILFPAFGYLILFNDEVARFLSLTFLEKTQHSAGWVSAIWSAKLQFVYFGLMSLGVGSIIYQMFCPRVIKRHGDPLDFIRQDTDSIGEEMLRYIRQELTDQGVWGDVFYDKADTLSNLYRIRAQSNPIARWVISFLFILGLLLLAVPSAITAWKVTIISLGFN
jgi:hypothetical protein